MSKQSADVVVEGGGIVGASAAYRLARAGARAVLIDRADTGYATGAGAGIIAPGTHATMPPGFYPLAFAAVASYPELLGMLAEDGEQETGYEVVGSLFVATDEAELARLPAIRQLARERFAQGVANIGEVRQLTGAEARALFPALAEVPAALYVPGSARLEARTLRQAMLRAGTKHGLTVVQGSAAVLAARDRVTAVQVNGEAITAGAVILAAGAWSADVAATLGFRLPIAPQRGQIMHLTLPDQSTSSWPIVTGFHSHYQLTFPPNRVVVGATREQGSGYDYRLTAGGVQEVLNEALRVSPGLGPGTIAEIRIGFRPASPITCRRWGRHPATRTSIWRRGTAPRACNWGRSREHWWPTCRWACPIPSISARMRQRGSNSVVGQATLSPALALVHGRGGLSVQNEKLLGCRVRLSSGALSPTTASTSSRLASTGRPDGARRGPTWANDQLRNSRID